MHFCQLPALFPQITEELLNNIFRDLPFLDNTTAIEPPTEHSIPEKQPYRPPYLLAIIFV